MSNTNSEKNKIEISKESPNKSVNNTNTSNWHTLNQKELREEKTKRSTPMHVMSESQKFKIHIAREKWKPQEKVVVIENGSYNTHYGISGEILPRGTFRTCIDPKGNIGSVQKKGIYPVKDKLITNMQTMTTIWEHIAAEKLKMKINDISVAMLEYPFNPRKIRAETTEVMFEKMQVKNFHFCSAPKCAIYASLLSFPLKRHIPLHRREYPLSGIAVDIGYESTLIVPVAKDVIKWDVIWKLPIGGKHVTMKLSNLFEKNFGMIINFETERDIVEVIKKKYGFVSEDFESDLTKAECTDAFEVEHILPNKKKMVFNYERFYCTDVLFKPFDYKNIIPICENGIQNHHDWSKFLFDRDINNEIHLNYVLTGGTSLFPGLFKRFESSLYGYKNLPGKVNRSKNGDKLNWIGASGLTCSESFKNQWISKSLYEEDGVLRSLFKKCHKPKVKLEEYMKGVQKCKSLIWNVENYKYFPNFKKKRSLLILLCCGRKESPFFRLPTDVVHLILKFLFDSLRYTEQN